MADFIPLEDAATLLGVSVDDLKDMRSRGEIFGFRDGSSWKFKSEEIERVRSELAGDVLDDDPGGSSILISERSVGAAGSKHGSTLGGSSGSGSDLRLEDDEDDDSDALMPGSDVALVADPSSQSGVRLVNRNAPAPADDDDEVLELVDDSESGSSLMISDLNLEGLSDGGASSTPGSGIATGGSSGRDVLGSDILAGTSASRSDAPSDAADLIHGDSDADLNIIDDDDDDDLVLGGDSGLALKNDSGIRLNSPSDSGISLEAEPIDLSGTGISGLGLGSDDFGSNPSGSGVGSGSGISGVDFASAEDFQLSPSGGLEADDDSGSQVIELEDSSDFAAADAGGFGAVDGGFDQGDGVVGFDDDAGQPVGAYAGTVPDTQFAGWQVGTLLVTICILGLSGILVTDIGRNMWAAADGSGANLNSWLSEAIRGFIPE